MTTFRSEEGLVGLMALVIVAPWIGWTLVRGVRSGRLPIGRAYVRRDERPGAYRVLLAFWVSMCVLCFVIGLDLLFGIGVRFWL